MFDHVIIDVADLEASRAFYERALAPLGISIVMELDGRTAFGPESGRPQFWLVARGTPGASGVHVAVAAADREAVDAFHGAALAAGGRDNGPPGLRPQYHSSYYGAFVLDPDGNNIEAVHHGSGL
ncbi:MAG TPA: VOC family protein [Gaiellaceae bacterium]|nr:VOC family protein [Gaiellaceae bacterium]